MTIAINQIVRIRCAEVLRHAGVGPEGLIGKVVKEFGPYASGPRYFEVHGTDNILWPCAEADLEVLAPEGFWD